MAALIGYLNYGHHAGTIHRLAHRDISSKLATWEGDIETYLAKDGSFSVYANGYKVAEGNVNQRKES